MTKRAAVRKKGMRPVLLIVLVAWFTGCGDDGPLVTYERGFGGIAGGHATLRIERDGTAKCGSSNFRLQDAELDRLRDRVAAAEDVRPRTRDLRGVEAPTVHVITDDYELDYVGLQAVPASAFPLTTELDRLIANHCEREGP